MDLYKNVVKDVADYAGDSGMCEDDPRILSLVNESRRILYKLGDWDGTTEPLCLRAYCGEVTLPNHIDYIKRAFRSRTQIKVENEWYATVQGNDFVNYCGSDCGRIIKLPHRRPTFREYPIVPMKAGCAQPGFLIQVVPESGEDCGTTIKFITDGVSQNTLSLTRTLQGAWMPVDQGIAEAYSRSIRYVVKPKTAGRIRVYGYDGANKILLAVYDPDDVDPSYAVYSVGGRNFSCWVAAKGKKRYIPLTGDPDEMVDINTDALIHTIQALALRRARDVVGYSANVKMAVDLLNRELSGPESTGTSPIQMSDAYRVESLNQ